MSNFNSLWNKMWVKLSTSIETASVEMLKNLIRPIIITTQVKEMDMKLPSIALEDYSPEEQKVIKGEMFLEGEDPITPGDCVTDYDNEVPINDYPIDIVVPRLVYSTREYDYRNLDLEELNRLNEDIRELSIFNQLSNESKDFNKVKTFKELSYYMKLVLNESLAESKEEYSKLVSRPRRMVTKVSDNAGDTINTLLKSFGLSMASTRLVVNAIVSSNILYTQYVTTITKTMANILKTSAAMASDPHTSRQVAPYLKKEIVALLLEVDTMTSEAQKLALKIEENLDDMVAPDEAIIDLIEFMNTPYGGVAAYLMFGEQSAPFYQILDASLVTVKFIKESRMNLVNQAVVILNQMNVTIDLSNYEELNSLVNQVPSTEYQKQLTKGVSEAVDAAKKAVDEYEKLMYKPAQKLDKIYLANTNSINDIIKKSGAKYPMFVTKSTFNQGGDGIKGNEYYSTMRNPNPEEMMSTTPAGKVQSQIVAWRDAFRPTMHKVSDEYLQLVADHYELERELKQLEEK